MRRREFLTLVCGGAVPWPLASRAEQSGKLPTVGFLGASSPSSWSDFVAAFEHRLRELGWINGSTVQIAYRWAEGKGDRYPTIAKEFVHLKADVIVTSGAAVRATMNETSVIPIVFAVASDPIGDGLVSNLARPEGNVTGLSLEATDIVGKRLGFLREALPHFHRLAIMANANYQAAMREMDDVDAAASKLGLEVEKSEIRRADDIAHVFEMPKGAVDALYVCIDSLLSANRVHITEYALTARLPTMTPDRAWTSVESGGALMSYGPSIPDLFRRAAEYVDKILRGAKPGDLPVEQPTKFSLEINLKTAKRLGLTMPRDMLAIADEVIE